MKTAESVAWRVERRVSASVAFDGAQFAPAVAWRLRRSAIFSVRFVAAAHLLGVTRKQWTKQSFPLRKRGPGTKTLPSLDAGSPLRGINGMPAITT
jgi:hypothetical protein